MNMKIDKIIVKVASRCNINCSYCYMYNLGDLSYKLQPKFIDNKTVKKFAEKLLSHLLKNKTDSVVIIIHGGEPLMMNKTDFVSFINCFNEQMEFFLTMSGVNYLKNMKLV
jgi:uncharacterized protein